MLNLPAPLLHQMTVHRRQLSFSSFGMTVWFSAEEQEQERDAAELAASGLETSFSKSSCFVDWVVGRDIDAAVVAAASGALLVSPFAVASYFEETFHTSCCPDKRVLAVAVGVAAVAFDAFAAAFVVTVADHAFVNDASEVVGMPYLEDNLVEASSFDDEIACFAVGHSPFVASAVASVYVVDKQQPKTMGAMLDHMRERVYMQGWEHSFDAFVVEVKIVVQAVVGHRQDLVGNHLAVCTDCTYLVAEP